jgi:SAM-dependent methyltransferase
MVTVVCFLENAAKALREAGRILKHQGALIIGFIDRESPLGRQYTLRKKQSRFYREATFYTVGELEALLTTAGLSGFIYRQALFPEETSHPIVQEGHGSGSFVVIRALKTEGGTPT